MKYSADVENLIARLASDIRQTFRLPDDGAMVIVAINSGVCRVTAEVNCHRVIDTYCVGGKTECGIELTDAGRRHLLGQHDV